MVAWFCFSTLLLATHPIPELTLAQALRMAVAEQPALQAAAQQQAGAQARLLQAESLAYPQVGLAAQALGASINGSQQSYLSMPNFPSVPSGGSAVTHHSNTPAINSVLGIAGTYPLLDFGQIQGSVQAADADRVAAQAMARQVLQDTLLGVSRAYFEALAAREGANIAQEGLQRAVLHQNLAAASVKSGLKPKIDLARSDAELGAAQYGLIQAENWHATSRAALEAAMGQDGPQNYSLVPIAAPAAALALDEASALQRALDHRPDLQALAALQRAARAQLKAADSGHLPRLMLTGSASLRNAKIWPETFNWDVGLLINLPLFSGFLVEGQQNEARARIRQAQAQARVALQRMRFQLRQARGSLMSAQQAVLAADQQARNARANLDQAEYRYREGLGNIVELTDAQVQFMAAEQTVVQSRLTVQVSDVQYRHAYAGLAPP